MSFTAGGSATAACQTACPTEAIIFGDILRRPLAQPELDRLGREFSVLVFEEILTCIPVAGALEFLAAHASTRLLFVASATPQDELREIVRQRGLEGYFRGVYLGEVVFVGDAIGDLKHARAAGVGFVGRVPPGAESPFPPGEGLNIVCDLAELAGLLADRQQMQGLLTQARWGDG